MLRSYMYHTALGLAFLLLFYGHIMLDGLVLAKLDEASNCGGEINVTCVDAYVNDDVVLLCPFLDNTTFPIWWKRKDGNYITVALHNEINPELPGLSKRIKLSDISSNFYNMTIQNITGPDTGKYCCVTSTNHFQAVKFCSFLNIIEPNITIRQENNTLQCVVTKSSVEIEYTWRHRTTYGHHLPCHDRTGAFLNLNDLDVSDGFFTCRVTKRNLENLKQKVIGEYTVVTKDKLVDPNNALFRFNKKTSNLTFQITNADNLCYEWLRNNVTIVANKQFSHYKENVIVHEHACNQTFANNATSFVLQIENICDTDISATYTLHVCGKNRNISRSHALRTNDLLSIVPTKDVIDTTEGSNITLKCDYDSCLAIPISEVFWTKRPIKRKDNNLGEITIQRLVSKPSIEIHNVDVYDSGIYTCHVKAASYTAVGEDIVLLVKEKSKENQVIIIGAAVGSGMALMLSVFGLTMLAMKFHFRRVISLNNCHQTESNQPAINTINESHQHRENSPGENEENDQSTNIMINAYDEIDETQMAKTTQTSVDASSPILNKPPRRYENTVLPSSQSASARRYENTVLTSSPAAVARRYENTILALSPTVLDRRYENTGLTLNKAIPASAHQNLIKGVEQRQQKILEQCEQKQLLQNFDNKCFGLNKIEVLEYEEPFTVLNNDRCGPSHDIQDKKIRSIRI